jgi:oligopeptide/dipeptide ABC transporter ATP-binding protein
MTALLTVEHLVKHYDARNNGFFATQHGIVHAIDDVSFEVARGETLSIVGETGCGKTTLARCITRLTDITSGRVVFDGEDLTRKTNTQMRPFRRHLQIVFQDPYASLNPRHRIGDIIGEPLLIHRVAGGGALRRRVEDLMEVVGLDPAQYERYPYEFSGGQRQRVAIARAISLKPQLVVCDEPVSALDVSIRAQILNLLTNLQREFGLTYVFISHDLAVVRHLSTRVAVMYLGKIVELAPAQELFARPRHPYTAALLAAMPVPDPAIASARHAPVIGDPPSPLSPPPGCRFHPRCPRASDICRRQEPALIPQFEDSEAHPAACHFPIADGEAISMHKV